MNCVLTVHPLNVDFMTRQERRRKARKKNTTYTMTAEQLATIAAEGEKQALRTMQDGLNQELKEEGKRLTLQAFQQTFYIPLLILRNEGWGRKRLKRFADKMVEQIDMFEDKYYTSEDVREMLKKEAGIDIKFKLDFKNQKSNIKVEAHNEVRSKDF